MVSTLVHIPKSPDPIIVPDDEMATLERMTCTFSAPSKKDIDLSAERNKALIRARNAK